MTGLFPLSGARPEFLRVGVHLFLPYLGKVLFLEPPRSMVQPATTPSSEAGPSSLVAHVAEARVALGDALATPHDHEDHNGATDGKASATPSSSWSELPSASARVGAASRSSTPPEQQVQQVQQVQQALLQAQQLETQPQQLNVAPTGGGPVVQMQDTPNGTAGNATASAAGCTLLTCPPPSLLVIGGVFAAALLVLLGVLCWWLRRGRDEARAQSYFAKRDAAHAQEDVAGYTPRKAAGAGRQGRKAWAPSLDPSSRDANKMRTNWHYAPPDASEHPRHVSKQYAPEPVGPPPPARVGTGFDPCASALRDAASSADKVVSFGGALDEPAAAAEPVAGRSFEPGLLLPAHLLPPDEDFSNEAASDTRSLSDAAPLRAADDVDFRARLAALSDDADKIEHRYQMALLDSNLNQSLKQQRQPPAPRERDGAGAGAAVPLLAPTLSSRRSNLMSPDDVAALKQEDLERVWQESYLARGGSASSVGEHDYVERDYKKPVVFVDAVARKFSEQEV